MSSYTNVQLKAAEMASSAVAMLSTVQKDFPQLEGAFQASLELMNATMAQAGVGIALEPRKSVPINGRRAPQKGLSLRLVHSTPSVEKGSEEAASAWEPASQREVSKCKALLLEVLRRAAHDWILYRQHHKMGFRELAEDAYIWLFEEEEGHSHWRLRTTCMLTNSEGKLVKAPKILTSFLAICEALDLDPDVVRKRVRKMDVKTIMSAGRPAESRRSKPPKEKVELAECGVLINIDMDKLQADNAENSDEYESQYEAYAAVPTPGFL